MATSSLTTLADLEWSIRSLKDSAFGTDLIPAAVWKIDPPVAASLIFPLAFKSAMLAQAPFTLSDGMHFELYKGKGKVADCASSKAILITDGLAKIIRKPIRASC